MAEVLSEHHVFVLLVQFTVILLVATVFGDLMQKMGQPTVLGELLAGVVLGPSILGLYWPAGYQLLFPADPLSFHLLEMVSWLGMILILFITGLETDIKVLSRIGKSAIRLAAVDFIFAFTVGALIGFYLPDAFMGELHSRKILAFFLGVTFSITAIPVLAKILIELDLIKRNFGLAALGAGIAEGMAAWLGLSVLLDLAHRGKANIVTLSIAIVVPVIFILVSWTLGRKLTLALFATADDKSRKPFIRISVAMIIALVGAFVAQWIGIHALFGAFIAGLIVAQSPRFTKSDQHIFEGVTSGIFAPIFFSFAGLQVRLNELTDWGFSLFLLMAAIGVKLIGSYMGGRFVGFRYMESLAMGIGLNARGEMAIVLALVGLSSGIISPALFTIVVVIAVITSLIAPPLLRLVTRYIPITEGEAERFRQQALDARAFFKKSDIKILIPTGGGPNAGSLFSFAAPLSAAGRAKLSFLMVRDPGRSFKEKVKKMFNVDRQTQNLTQEADSLKELAKQWELSISPKIATSDSRAEVILSELKSGQDLLFIGTHSDSDPFGGDVLEPVLADTPAHVALFKAGPNKGPQIYRKILLATKGDSLFPFVFEFAALYAESLRTAKITVLYVSPPKKKEWIKLKPSQPFDKNNQNQLTGIIQEAIETHTQKQSEKLNVEQKVIENADVNQALLKEAKSGSYDLILMGGMKHMVREKLFFGYKVEDMIKRSPCAFVLLTPKVVQK